MLEVSAGNQPAAIEDFRKVLDSQPDNTIALNNLAFLLAENGKADEALKYAQKAVQLAPDKPDFEDTLGWVLYRKGLYEAAITHLKSAVSKGGDLRLQYHLATAYFRSGDEARGHAILTAALRKDPSLPEAQIAQQAARETGSKSQH
jgi:Tfp pilus assembly protein PilF